MLFNIFIANHGKLGGVEDFISILQNIIQKRGYQVEVSEELNPNAINVLIDEFTNSYTNLMITEFKSTHPNAVLIYVLTEFIEKRLLVRSFNFFGNILDASVIAVLNVYIRLHRQDFNKPTIWHWVLAIVYFPLFPVFYLSRYIKKKKKVAMLKIIHSLAYMLMRYMGLERMLPYADGVVISHNSINLDSDKVPVLGVIYPEFDYADIERKIFGQKILGVEVTGSITSYRHRVINKVNSSIMQQGLKKYFNVCQIIAFSSSKKDVPRAAFSIHPPQTKHWKYSSPTRIYRALQFDHNMPILTKVFNQHPIEKLCLVFNSSLLLDMIKFYKHPKMALDFLQPRVQEYNRIAKLENDEMVNAMIALAKQRLAR